MNNPRKSILDCITIRGFKSIREMDSLPLKRLNVLIGANGSGKSNFISFFRLLSWMTSSGGQLQEFVARAGGAHALLFDGPKVTNTIESHLVFIDLGEAKREYTFKLVHAAPDALIFTDERYGYSTGSSPPRWENNKGGHPEAMLLRDAEKGNRTAQAIRAISQHCIVHQFHDTSATSRMKQKWHINENRFLKEDGGNLAPYLLRLRSEEPRHYSRIIETVRMIFPSFAEFVLEPKYDSILLQWHEKESDYEFDVSQASDGTLRAMALVALLMQPEEEFPDLIVIDEPELGLHPSAIDVIAGLIRAASLHTQLILATQSPTLVNYFEPEDIIVVDRPNRESVFKRLESTRLEEWLQEYTIGDLWEKNVLGGIPTI